MYIIQCQNYSEMYIIVEYDIFRADYRLNHATNRTEPSHDTTTRDRLRVYHINPSSFSLLAVLQSIVGFVTPMAR